jgi:hypothetical protein
MATVGQTSVELTWLAVGAERDWTLAGSAKTLPLPGVAKR